MQEQLKSPVEVPSEEKDVRPKPTLMDLVPLLLKNKEVFINEYRSSGTVSEGFFTKVMQAEAHLYPQFSFSDLGGVYNEIVALVSPYIQQKTAKRVSNKTISSGLAPEKPSASTPEL